MVPFEYFIKKFLEAESFNDIFNFFLIYSLLAETRAYLNSFKVS